MTRLPTAAAAAILTGAGVLISVAPASAHPAACYCMGNGTSLSGLTQVHAFNQSTLLPRTAAVSEMNGVSVEGVILPTKTER